MRKLFLKLVIGFVTFAVGISAVSVAGRLATPQAESVILVAPVYKSETGIPRFMPTARACGEGYSQFYFTDDEHPLAEGVRWMLSPRAGRREVRKLVSDAKQIVERVPKFRNHRGDVGERIVVINKADEEGKESVSILFYEGGDSYRFIDAPTLELALEFEQYLISIDFRSPF